MRETPKTIRMTDDMIAHIDAMSFKDSRKFAPMVVILLQEAIDNRSVETTKPATD